jgi:hypothetical protein
MVTKHNSIVKRQDISMLQWMMAEGFTAAAGARASYNSRPRVSTIQARAGQQQHGKGYGKKQLPKTFPKVRSCCSCCLLGLGVSNIAGAWDSRVPSYLDVRKI